MGWFMDVDDNKCETSHSSSLQLSLSQLFHTLDEQTPSTAYPSMSPVSSLPVRFDSPTMHNCITHHHTSLFITSVSPFKSSHHKVWLKIISADGGRGLFGGHFCRIAHVFFSRCYSFIVLKCRKACEKGCVVYSMCLSWSIYMCVGVYERQRFV